MLDFGYYNREEREYAMKKGKEIMYLEDLKNENC